MSTTYKIGDIYLRLEESRKYFNPIHDTPFIQFQLSQELSEDWQGDNQPPTFSLTESAKALFHNLNEMLENNETWELWRDSESNYIFRLKHYREPFLTTRINPDFSEGSFQWEIVKPLSSQISIKEILDIRLFLNLLANFGDLVLHASGFVYRGKGYCFLGESGRGKSTIIRDLAEVEDLVVLGEDQVILRYLDGHFHIFGTPWHTDPDLCAAMDAPLEKMFFLDRDQTETIREMSAMEIVSRILQTAFVPWYRKDCLPLILERIGLLPENVQSRTLSYKLGQDNLQTILDA